MSDLPTEVAARLPDAPPERAERLAAATAYVGWQGFMDGHLSRAEEATIRRSLARDFEPEEIELTLVLLRDEPALVRAESSRSWSRTLFPLVARRE